MERDPIMAASTHDDLFLMVNLYPARTGLPMTVWAGPRGKARHAARIKVNMTHGPTMDVHNTAVVGIQPMPHLIAGTLAAADRDAVFAWIELNREALLEHWTGNIDGGDMAARTRRLP
jgi:hypothetical protein